MRHLSAGILLSCSLACWAGSPRVSPPAAVGVAVHPVDGRLVVVEGVAGRLSLGRQIWDGAVDGVWPAASSAIIRLGTTWHLLEFNQDWSVSRVLDLGEKDWTAPVWNARGSAWLACSESTDRCGIYRAEDGSQVREIRATSGLRALSLSDAGFEALLRQNDHAVLWSANDELVPVAEGEGILGAFAPGGARLAVIDSSGVLRLVDVPGVNSKQVEAPADAVGLLWKGELLLTVHRSGEIRRWNERGETVSAVHCECQPGGVWGAGQGMVRLHDSLKQISHYLDFERGDGSFTMLPAVVPEIQ